MLIDCDCCAVRGPACQDCVVTFMLGLGEAGQVDLTAEEVTAMGVLADQGVVPPLRLRLLPGGGHADHDAHGGAAAASH